jgi:type I restriction enzyme S subunit
MSEAKELKLGSIAKVISGYAFKSVDFMKSNGIPAIKIKNIKNGEIDLSECDFVNETFLTLNIKYHVNRNDILVSLTGSHLTQPNSVVGRIAIYRHDRVSLLNQRAGKILPNVKLVEPRFLYFFLSQDSVKESIAKKARGAANQANISPGDVEDTNIYLPPLSTQKRIASILSAYDDLIENNLKRIKLLEEIAQRTYEEWFVKFRVNGEQLPMDEEMGLPVGWERKKLSEIADIKWGDTSVTKSSYCEKGFLAYSASGPDGLLDYFDYDKSGVVLSAIGAYAGLTWLALGKWSAIKNTMVFWSKQKTLSNHYLFLATRGINYWNRRGAAQPFIAQGDAKLQQIVLPNEDINIQFSKIVEPIYEVIYKLNATNKLLKESRDIILPRLMSGTLNVES